jgi:catechol 2,3-dioxygenase-like lactoylglutathione lyase family enzyme
LAARQVDAMLQSLNAVRIFVNDLDRARGFYADMLGLRETAAATNYAVFAVDNVSVIVETLPGSEPDHRDLIGRFLPVSFNVAGDLDMAYVKLRERGVNFVQPPETQPWGGTLAFLRDPDGNVLTLVG